MHYIVPRDLHPFHRLGPGDFYPPPDIPDKLAIALPDPKYLIGAHVQHEILRGRPVEFRLLTSRSRDRCRSEQMSPARAARSTRQFDAGDFYLTKWRLLPVSDQTRAKFSRYIVALPMTEKLVRPSYNPGPVP